MGKTGLGGFHVVPPLNTPLSMQVSPAPQNLLGYLHPLIPYPNFQNSGREFQEIGSIPHAIVTSVFRDLAVSQNQIPLFFVFSTVTLLMMSVSTKSLLLFLVELLLCNNWHFSTCTEGCIKNLHHFFSQLQIIIIHNKYP